MRLRVRSGSGWTLESTKRRSRRARGFLRPPHPPFVPVMELSASYGFQGSRVRPLYARAPQWCWGAMPSFEPSHGVNPFRGSSGQDRSMRGPPREGIQPHPRIPPAAGEKREPRAATRGSEPGEPPPHPTKGNGDGRTHRPWPHPCAPPHPLPPRGEERGLKAKG